jgi:hypothetical protein
MAGERGGRTPCRCLPRAGCHLTSTGLCPTRGPPSAHYLPCRSGRRHVPSVGRHRLPSTGRHPCAASQALLLQGEEMERRERERRSSRCLLGHLSPSKCEAEHHAPWPSPLVATAASAATPCGWCHCHLLRPPPPWPALWRRERWRCVEKRVTERGW